MATIKLVSPDPAAVYWRAALGSLEGLPAEPIDKVIDITVLTKNYYKINIDQLDVMVEVIKKFNLEEELTVIGNYQINGQTGQFSKLVG